LKKKEVMKTLILSTLAIFVFAVSAYTQEIERPKKGAVIHMEKYNYDLKAGSTIEFEARLVKSLKDESRTFGGLEISKFKGLTTEIVQDSNDSDLYLIKVSADADMAGGKYAMVLKGTGKNDYKVRSTLVTINVSSDSLSSVQN
jgi:hypothetical protein